MATTRIEPAVCFGSSQRSWVTELINYVSDHGGMRVVGTVLTQDDAIEMSFDVLVIDDVSSVLSPRLVDRLHATNRIVVGVFDADRGNEARERLMKSGVDGAVASDATAADIVRVVSDVVRQESVDREFTALIDDISERDAESVMFPQTPGPDPSARGRIIVVMGSDGATETTVALANTFVSRGASTIVVDLDTLEPSIAQRLAMPLTPNIFTATEHLRLRSDLSDSFVMHSEGFAVIAGIPSPREWDNFSETEAADLIEELTSGFQIVLVVTSRHLEDLSTFGGTAGRFDVGRRIAAMADEVIVVGSPSPLGNTRLLGTVSDVRQLSRAPVHLYVNKAPTEAFLQGEITEEVERTVAIASIVFLPTDNRVRKASWQGDVVRKGPFARKIASAADAFVPSPKSSRRQKRKLTREQPERPPEHPAVALESTVEDAS